MDVRLKTVSIHAAKEGNAECWYLRCLDMIVEVVSKRLDMTDDLFSSLWCQVSREEHKGNIADLSLTLGQPGKVLQLQGWVIPKEYLRRVLYSSSPGIDELLQKDLAEDSVCLFTKDGGKDDGDTVMGRFDVDSLFVSVMN